jgi:TonB family protein
MVKLRILPATLLILASSLCSHVAAFPQKLCPFKAPVGEAGLRKQKATKRVHPVYPKESLKNSIGGKVIVDILVDEHGKVPEAKVSQAPDELTGQAVVDAAKQWEFKVPPKIQGRQLCYSSTLSFKFEIRNGKGKVVDDPVN